MKRESWKLLAEYNSWMNEKLYEACESLTNEELWENRRAFFGSIIGTLNHIAVADTIWLKRFRSNFPFCATLEPLDRILQPERLDQTLFEEFQGLTQYRKNLDHLISTWVDGIGEDDLVSIVRYKNMRGIESSRKLASLLLHFFNHQTHHRGQVSNLLYQVGIDIGVTDLLALTPEED